MGIGFYILLFAAIFFGSIALVLCAVVAAVIGWIAFTADRDGDNIDIIEVKPS